MEELKLTGSVIGCIAIVRADDMIKCNTAMHDLLKYANLSFIGSPIEIDVDRADEVLCNVMHMALKQGCKAAQMVRLLENAGLAINNIKGIHPPAHVIIVSNRHGDIFDKLKTEFQ